MIHKAPHKLILTFRMGQLVYKDTDLFVLMWNKKVFYSRFNNIMDKQIK